MQQKLIVVGRKLGLASWGNFPHLRSALSDHFVFEDWREGQEYSDDTWFLILANSYRGVKDQFKDSKVIIDVCCEANMSKWDSLYEEKIPHHIIMYGNVPAKTEDDAIYVPNFFWYNEALSQPLNFTADFNYKQKFLMPMGRKTALRDQVVEKLTPYLEDAYWSYVRRGRALPGEPEDVAGAKRYDTRRENPMWYNDTCFSLVLESVTKYENSVPFLTEKIYKPIRHLHPYMVVGAPGILKYLRSQGFETYDNLFDESYDEIEDLDQRLDIFEQNIRNFEKRPYDQLTIDKAVHNQQLFYNIERIKQDMKKSIVEPVFDIMEKR